MSYKYKELISLRFLFIVRIGISEETEGVKIFEMLGGAGIGLKRMSGADRLQTSYQKITGHSSVLPSQIEVAIEKGCLSFYFRKRHKMAVVCSVVIFILFSLFTEKWSSLFFPVAAVAWTILVFTPSFMIRRNLLRAIRKISP